jgi:hypothetical protein
VLTASRRASPIATQMDDLCALRIFDDETGADADPDGPDDADADVAQVALLTRSSTRLMTT